jgi:hypothetical protein
MRKTIELTGAVTTEDLTSQAQDDFIAIYRRWHADQDPPPPSE